jgi:hypothetical protein
MGEKEYVVYLDDIRQNRYRHFHRTERGQVVIFRIQYEAYIDGIWRAIVRYDTAHGFPHQDILHPDGTENKKAFPGHSNAEVLTLGQRDIRRNWKRYRHHYEREMRGEQ